MLGLAIHPLPPPPSDRYFLWGPVLRDSGSHPRGQPTFGSSLNNESHGSQQPVCLSVLWTTTEAALQPMAPHTSTDFFSFLERPCPEIVDDEIFSVVVLIATFRGWF